MKKENKPTEGVKKSPKKLKRKAAQAELAALLERFSTVADRLEQAVDRLAPVRMGPPHTN
jgi:hypothetical protein